MSYFISRCALATCLGLASLSAASVEGTITFEKAPPTRILVWVPGVTHAAQAEARINQKGKVFCRPWWQHARVPP